MQSTAPFVLISWILALVPVISAGPPAQPPISWRTDYSAALKEAEEGGKIVLLNFTGSDWCVWCHRLRDEVFLQKPFRDYAEESLVLVELDFPRKKSQPGGERRQNEALAEKFAVSGYPTVVLVDAGGRELGRTGYIQGGAKTFVRELKRFAASSPVPKN